MEVTWDGLWYHVRKDKTKFETKLEKIRDNLGQMINQCTRK